MDDHRDGSPCFVLGDYPAAADECGERTGLAVRVASMMLFFVAAFGAIYLEAKLGGP
jgi:hypothetical protein